MKRLTGARTLPQNFYAKVWESVGSVFRRGMKLEVVDKMRICQVSAEDWIKTFEESLAHCSLLLGESSHNQGPDRASSVPAIR